MVSISRICLRNEFCIFGLATLKAQQMQAQSWYDGTVSWWLEAEQKWYLNEVTETRTQ